MKPKHYIEFIPKLILYGLYHLSGWMPRRKYKWAFGSHFGFKDNSKFLIMEAIEQHPEIRPIWIAHKKNECVNIRTLGFECYYWLSIKGLYHAFTSGVYVCTRNTIEINRVASKGAVYLNLNHGVGAKKCYWLRPYYIMNEWGLTVKEAEKSFMFKVLAFPWYIRVPDICLVTSRMQAETFFAPMFNIPLDNCLYGSYPRNRLLMSSKKEIMERACKYEPKVTSSFIDMIERYDKIYIYMPTWRNGGEDFINLSGIDFRQLNEALKKRNELFILKLHPLTKIDLFSIECLSNVITFDPSIDIYYISPFTDCLITDYSSIYSDYLLMNKEVILYVFDLEDYQNTNCLADYDKYYLGTRARNFGELLNLIENRVDCHLPKVEYDFIMDTYWDSAFNGVDIIEEVKKRMNSYQE